MGRTKNDFIEQIYFAHSIKKKNLDIFKKKERGREYVNKRAEDPGRSGTY